MHDSRVVIAGGGVAGHRIAFALQKEARVTLIDPKDFFEIPMAVPRLLVEPARASEAVIPYSEFLPAVDRIQGKLSAVRKVAVGVTTSAGDSVEVPFDFLVLATGSNYPEDTLKAHHGGAQERSAHFERMARSIRDAGSVAVVGGGPVGVEIAAEILEEKPAPKLTLLQSANGLLPFLTPFPRQYALNHLERRGADIRFGHIAGRNNPPEAGLVLWCMGYRIDTSYLRDYPDAVLDSTGHVLVDSNLRMAGTANIFGVGDITALPEPKLGIWAGKHAAVVAENLRRLLRSNKSKLASYTPATGSRIILVTLGRRHGAGHLRFGDFTNSWLARKIKSDDMFIGRYRKGIGLARRVVAPTKAVA